MRLLENKVQQMERLYILQIGRLFIMRPMTAHIFSLRFRRFQERNLEVIEMKAEESIMPVKSVENIPVWGTVTSQIRGINIIIR